MATDYGKITLGNGTLVLDNGTLLLKAEGRFRALVEDPQTSLVRLVGERQEFEMWSDGTTAFLRFVKVGKDDVVFRSMPESFNIERSHSVTPMLNLPWLKRLIGLREAA